MKNLITIILLTLSLSAIGQSLTVSNNGNTIVTESTFYKNIENLQLGATVLSGEQTSLGYKIGTNLSYGIFEPNIGLINTISFNRNVYFTPNASIGIRIVKVSLFVDYKLIYQVTGGGGDSFIGFGIRL